MARDLVKMAQERKDIHDMFKELFNEKEFGVRKYDIEWIYAKIGDKFYKTPRTIREILSKPLPETKEARPEQTNLFSESPKTDNIMANKSYKADATKEWSVASQINNKMRDMAVKGREDIHFQLKEKSGLAFVKLATSVLTRQLGMSQSAAEAWLTSKLG